jgi:peptide-methionine (S)-S-oxide reductase
MGDHTEALQVEFDSTQISFEVIVELFWRTHNPCATAYSRQYRSAIWYHDAEQKEVLERSLAAVSDQFDGGVSTAVEPLQKFYLAENYHQKYRLQSRKALMKKFKQFYADFEDFNNSTAAARLNGMAGGNRVLQLFKEEGATYGFDFDELKTLIR